MSKMPLEFEGDTEKTYDALISIIENNQGRLAPIIVGCDELRLRERVIERYEREAKVVKIRPYRIWLGSEPSVRAGLDKLVSREEYLQAGGEAVFTVLWADTLLRVKLRAEDEQSELEKFFGYLQWTREGLRSFRFPIVLWVSIRMLREMGRRAPDFWSWRKASFQFGTEDERLAAISREPIEVSNVVQDYEFLPPLDELLQELKELHDRDLNSPNLLTLYSKIGKVYANRVESGEAKNLEFERSAAIEYFEKAIEGMRDIGENIGYASTLTHLGNFLISQSDFIKATEIFHTALEFAQANKFQSISAICFLGLGGIYGYLGDYKKAIDFYEKSLKINRDSNNQLNIGITLANLGSLYMRLKDHQKAIDYYSQAIEIQKMIGDRRVEAGTLCDLGSCYCSIGQHEKAISLLEQALPIHREFKDRSFEANSLRHLGFSYNAIGNPKKAFDYGKEALDISRTIGDRRGEALSFFFMAQALAKLDRSFEALQTYQKAQTIFEEIPIDYAVKQCKDAIRRLNQIIPAHKAKLTPEIPKRQYKKKSMSRDEKVFFWFVAGITIVLLIWWLKK